MYQVFTSLSRKKNIKSENSLSKLFFITAYDNS